MTGDTFLPATQMARRISEKIIAPTELLDAHLRRIERLNPRLNAVIDRDAERTRREAAAANSAVMQGRELGPLHGVPITIKSCIDVEGLRCECGTRLREGYVAEKDAPLVNRLRQAGAIILGVTNVPDLLVAYETDNLLYGRTNSPWNTDYTPGGSSGGEAAAIAAGCSAAGMGSDGGGSVRVPAHFSGICGLKPTPGVIPRTGHWPACIGPSALLGLVGPMARTVADLRVLLEVATFPDDQDPSWTPVTHPAVRAEEIKALKAGWFATADFTGDGPMPVTPETRSAVETAAQSLADQGLRVEPVSITGLERARGLWWNLFGVVASTLLKPHIRGREHDLHPLVKDLTAPPGEVTTMTYEQFLQTWIERDELRARLLEKMRDYRILLSPVSAAPAFRHGERSWTIEGQQVSYAQSFVYSQVYNLLGNPAAVVPVGRSPEGLPIGVQVIGRPFEESLVLAVAEKIEQGCGGFRPPPEALLE